MSATLQKVATLTILPPGLLLAIIAHLKMDDTLILCDISRFFSSFIPQPTHEQTTDEDFEKRKSLESGTDKIEGECGNIPALLGIHEIGYIAI